MAGNQKKWTVEEGVKGYIFSPCPWVAGEKSSGSLKVRMLESESHSVEEWRAGT